MEIIISLALNCILLFCLFSPNIVMFIHNQHFLWKNRVIDALNMPYGSDSEKRNKYKIRVMKRLNIYK
jgi:hypothetical protein